jgi:hypothetical protein
MFVGYGFEKGKFCVAGSAKETIKNHLKNPIPTL